MNQAYICDAIRTPFGRYGGVLSSVRTDDLGAIPIAALMARNPQVDWAALTDLIYGCVNQAGEDNRNVGRMAALLAGCRRSVRLHREPPVRLGLDALGSAARAIKAGEATMMIAGGVESMSRAPFVMGKAESAFSRNAEIFDTTIGWRFVNKLMKQKYGTDSMPETAENVADEYRINREDQDRMALASQLKAVAAQKTGYFDAEITPVTIPQKKGDALVVSSDEHPRETSLKRWPSSSPSCARAGDGRQRVRRERRCLSVADEGTAKRYGLTPRARVVGMATAGAARASWASAPAPATQKVPALTGLKIETEDARSS